jgi:hypothetical protein
MKTNVRDTHWGKQDQKNHENLKTAIPALLETSYQQWEARIAGIQDNTDRTQITVIAARQQVKKTVFYDGMEKEEYVQDGPEYTFLVTTSAGKGYMHAYDTVYKHMKAMYPGTYWTVWGKVNALYALKGD